MQHDDGIRALKRPLPFAVPFEPGHYRVFVRDLVLAADIGAYAAERGRLQRIAVSVELEVREPAAALSSDRLADVLDYDSVRAAVKAEVAAGHVNLVETLAARIAARCLNDSRVSVVRVEVVKLEVEPAAAGGIGIAIERRR